MGHGHPWALESDLLDLDWQRTVGTGHDPWGQDGSGAGVGLGYRGELVVDGLVWLRERAYDPATRAFLSPDPLPAVPGTAYAANPLPLRRQRPGQQRRPAQAAPGHRRRARRGARQRRRAASSIGHGLLDVAGLVPVVGEAADLANAAWYTAEGDYTMAALSAAAAIPFAGWAATGAKGVIKGGLRRWRIAPDRQGRRLEES